MQEDLARLDACGWSSFDVRLFLGEPGRRTRDVAAPFVRMLERHARGSRVLELCCGAGSLCIALARAGYHVTGLDLDERMLKVFRDRLEGEGSAVRRRVRMVQADMCDFSFHECFDFIILEDDGFVYLLDQADQLACLTCVRRHLAEAGRFFLHFTTPQQELADTKPFDYDPLRQIKTVPQHQWTREDENGIWSQVGQGFERRRLVYPAEMELLARLADLRMIERWGDLDGTPLADPTNQDYHFLIGR